MEACLRYVFWRWIVWESPNNTTVNSGIGIDAAFHVQVACNDVHDVKPIHLGTTRWIKGGVTVDWVSARCNLWSFAPVGRQPREWSTYCCGFPCARRRRCECIFIVADFLTPYVFCFLTDCDSRLCIFFIVRSHLVEIRATINGCVLVFECALMRVWATWAFHVSS